MSLVIYALEAWFSFLINRLNQFLSSSARNSCLICFYVLRFLNIPNVCLRCEDHELIQDKFGYHPLLKKNLSFIVVSESIYADKDQSDFHNFEGKIVSNYFSK